MKENVLSDMPINPRESVGPKARPKPTTHQATPPVMVSRQFFRTMPLQCCLLAALASTITNPSCMKKIRAADARIHDEFAPVLIESRVAYCAAVNGSAANYLVSGNIVCADMKVLYF